MTRLIGFPVAALLAVTGLQCTVAGWNRSPMDLGLMTFGIVFAVLAVLMLELVQRQGAY